MREFRPRPLLVAAFLFLMPSLSWAQKPTTEQAQRLLQTRPDLVQQLRQRIQTSGLTPEQIRARLRAEGYPESLLNAYLGEPGAATDSLPGDDVFQAVRKLGIVDSADVSDLEQMSRDRSRRQVRLPLSPTVERVPSDTADTVLVASTKAALDSLASRRVFGLDLFRRSTSQFEPNLAGPVDASYRLGPGDQLVLILTGDVEEAHTLDVTREGFVVIPRVGQLFVANLTLGQLNEVLFDRLARAYSGVRRGAGATTRFSVSVSRLRSNQIFVVGDVMQPGSYRVSSAGTALSALYAAGGPTDEGSLRRVDVRRGGRTVQTLDVYDYLLRGDASRDVRLETGDVLFVPVHGTQVRLSGEVTRPATYELAPNESLADLVRMAGGFTPTASLRRVQIERITPPAQRTTNGRDRFVIDVSVAAGEVPPMPLEAGDVVTVLPVADRVRQRLTVIGNVWQPGFVAYESGMMLSEALSRAGGLKSDTYLGEVLISRLRSDSSRTQLRATLRDTTGNVVNDVPLREDDEIRVFSVSEFRPARYVAVSGAVRNAGRYPYREGMTMRDLVLVAGGLDQSAYLQEAEIARLPRDRANGVTAATFRVPLDSSYLFERGRDGAYHGPPGLPAPTGAAPDQVLQAYDNILILRQPDWQLQRTVVITGEIRFPGVYTLRNKGERLSDLIDRSGGLTAEGYAAGMQFSRRHGDIGRIGIDLPRILKNGNDRDNLLLEDGDSVFVPRYAPLVNVLGEVSSPVAVAYAPGQNMDYYISRAGGPTRLADVKRAFVTQANGSVESRARRFLLFPNTPSPGAGSVVTVPARDASDRRDYTAAIGSIAQVLASLVAIIAIAKR